ncbi:MAG: 1-deoxy-D-xylulose-5-phosphate synthase [Gammaproteobacteria bacterium]|nr:1-deoxy-D-xylulose-5-phosphate synthase [Gammaproteobacteria bacterium]|tara:strand:- start:3256 stop:5145 length:1890 start_codon:yes stop_codon:yes gene_type:complete
MKSKYTLLDKIDLPNDLKNLGIKDLESLSVELRNFILDSVSKTGGHLASGLGAVELTISLHYVFDTPNDKIIWDVGHQCYPHKILTGRKNLMHTLRKKNGLSGFLKKTESEYDCFGAGHSSTSISVAIGYDLALKMKNENKKVVAVIGDGGLTAGMAYEAMCHAGDIDSDILVILNDNDMSISPNVGAIHKYLTRMLSGKTFSSIKDKSKKVFNKVKIIEDIAKKVETSAKKFITPGHLFEEIGFKYYGPVDGHDIPNLVKILANLKLQKGPRILHIITRKGKGYKLAEDNPINYHGVTPFDVKSGKKKKNKIENKLTYTNIFSEWITNKANNNDNLVAITPAMREGSGLVEFEKKFPDRYFDVGIAEQHSVTFAAGLAAEGMKPIVAIYSTFLQRAYDQVIHDVMIQELDVLFAIDRAGLVGADGETHHGIYDISYLRILPKFIVMTPSNEQEMWKMLNTGFDYKGPAAVRYPRGYSLGLSLDSDQNRLEIGKAKIIREGISIAYLVFGTLLQNVIKVAGDLNATVVDMRFVKPLDQEMLNHICSSHDLIITVEENSVLGGAGSAVNEYILSKNLPNHVHNIGVPDHTISHGSQDELLSELGLDEDGILKTSLELRKNISKLKKIHHK